MHDTRLTRDSLIAAYHASGKPRDQWRVGAEFERHLLDGRGIPLPYASVTPEGPGIRWLFERLTSEGWTPYVEGDYPIALQRGLASVTLEPGGQFELSGSPFFHATEVMDEALAFARSVAGHLAHTDVRQVALGFTPYAEIGDVGWVPKGRYAVMRDHLAATGSLAHHMMKGTAAVQATYDYSDEADCARKVFLASALGPLTTALFANSPYALGQQTGFMSYRGHIWTQTDPARTGFPAVAEGFSFERWVDWLLDVPMMFIRDPKGQWQPARGRTFRQWAQDPGDNPPDAAAWELHLTSVFPEVRIKHTIEVRGADCVPMPLSGAFVALWKGLLYDEVALDAALEQASAFVADGTPPDRFAIACREGLRGRIAGAPLTDWADRILTLASAGLERSDPADAALLAPLRELLSTGRSVAASLVERLGPQPAPADLVKATGMFG